MNKDHTSDLKKVQRLIFQHGLYVLQTFVKKLESFTQTKSKQARMKEKQYLQKPHTIGVDEYYSQKDPIASISKDLTKPIWNCIMNVDPRVVFFQDTYDEEIPILSLYNRLFRIFIERYKIEHQDQSNLKINLMMVNKNSFLSIDSESEIKSKRNSVIANVSDSVKSRFSLNLKSYNEDLFEMLKAHIEKQQLLLKQPDQMDMQEYENIFSQVNRTLQVSNQILSCLLQNLDPKLNQELNLFNKILVDNFNDVFDSKIGSLAICAQPKLAYLPLIVHPLMIGVNHCLKMQISQYLDKQEQRKKRQQSNALSKQCNQQEKSEIIQQNSFIYPTLKTAICSKIAFINLDGFESQFNIDLAKHLSKYLLYVSFPKQSTNKMENNNLRKFQDFNSKRLLQKYLHSGLTEAQKKQLLSFFQSDQKEQKKNLFVFPIHSRELSDNYELPNVQFYQSTFIKFMMKQVIFGQIRQLNPSMIILSYSPKTKISNEHFTEIIKQLTILANYRVVFYPNLSKMYGFQQQTPSQMIETSQYVQCAKAYYEKYEEDINIVDAGSRINTDFLDKLSIFLKVSSGTFNLSKQSQVDSYIEKFKNYKIMNYAGLLIKILGRDYPALQRVKMRANQYITISKVLANMFSTKNDTFDKLFGKILSKFHYGLLKTVQNQFFSEDQNPQIEYSELLQKINRKFDYVKKNDFWENFKFQYCLNITTEKTQVKLYAYIPRFSQTKSQTKSVNNLISLQFDIHIDDRKIPMQYTKDTKFHYTSNRKHKNALIYAINHLPFKQATKYCSYFGFLDEKVDNYAESKVIFKPVIFNMEDHKNLESNTTFCEFNYFETNQFIFFFWPQIFDCQKQLLSKIAGVKYTPNISNFIFQAKRSDPGVFNQLNVKNTNTYADILPRYGCTCYQNKQDQQFYIFGGFYNNQQNYLSFQTDITLFKYKNTQAIVQNVPKSFYFQFDTEKTNNNKKVVKKIHNDLVRPKVQYQIFQPEGLNKPDEKVIFLLGGIGQKFTRPYSMIGYMAQKLSFKNNQLVEVKRIRTNNLYPIPVKGPIKSFCANQMQTVESDQKRNIKTKLKHVPQQSEIYSHFSYSYDPMQEKLSFETEYEIAQLSNKSYREEISFKKNIIQHRFKQDLHAKCYRGKQLYTNFITISQTDKKCIQELQLEVQNQAMQAFPTLPSCVRLTGTNILALDINSSIIFALIKDPMATLNKCILAYYDLSKFSEKFNGSNQIRLKQIYQFDQDISKNILVAANQFNIAILHGCKFENNANIPEMVIKIRQNQIRTISVKPCNDFQELKNFKISPFKMNSTSLFLNQMPGVILCFSFRSIQKIKNGEKFYVALQELQLAESQIQWQKRLQKFYEFIIIDQNRNHNQNLNQKFITKKHFQNRQSEGIKVIQIKSKGQKQKSAYYELVSIYCDECYCGIFTKQKNCVQFRPMDTSASEYYKNYYRDNIRQDSKIINENSYNYDEAINENMEMSVQSQNV